MGVLVSSKPEDMGQLKRRRRSYIVVRVRYVNVSKTMDEMLDP